MIDASFLTVLRCPETYQPLREADSALVELLNSKIKASQLKNRAGQNVTQPMEGALVREDKKFAYPIRGRIPVMLIDEAIAV